MREVKSSFSRLSLCCISYQRVVVVRRTQGAR